MVSPLANASWARLAEEYVVTKDDPEGRQVLHNTNLARGWRAPGVELDEMALSSRAEDFDLDRVPLEVLLLTCGVDVQQDRLEVSVVGWTKTNHALVLEHGILWGAERVLKSRTQQLVELAPR